MLSHDHVSAVLQIPGSKSKKPVWELLRVVGYCWLWLIVFAEIAKALYASPEDMQHLEQTEIQQKAFKTLKKALVSVSVLSLPYIIKPFHL